MTVIDKVIEELQDIRERDPRVEYVGRRADGTLVQLNVTPALARKLLPVLRSDATKRRRA